MLVCSWWEICELWAQLDCVFTFFLFCWLNSIDWTLPETCVSWSASWLCRVHFSSYGSLHTWKGKVKAVTHSFETKTERLITWRTFVFFFSHCRISKRKYMDAQRRFWRILNGFYTTVSYTMEVGCMLYWKRHVSYNKKIAWLITVYIMMWLHMTHGHL